MSKPFSELSSSASCGLRLEEATAGAFGEWLDDELDMEHWPDCPLSWGHCLGEQVLDDAAFRVVVS